MNTQLLDSPEDCQWLCDTALKNIPRIPTFKSFLLYGNEDCPQRLELFKRKSPLTTDTPTAVYLLDGETLEYSRASLAPV